MRCFLVFVVAVVVVVDVVVVVVLVVVVVVGAVIKVEKFGEGCPGGGPYKFENFIQTNVRIRDPKQR